MRKQLDWIIPNGALIILVILLIIEVINLNDLNYQNGLQDTNISEEKLNINQLKLDKHYLIFSTVITSTLLILLVYSLIKRLNRLLNWTAFVTFVGISYLAIKIYLSGQGGEAIFVPIVAISLTILTVIKMIIEKNTGANSKS